MLPPYASRRVLPAVCFPPCALRFITSNTLDGARDVDGDGKKDEVAEVEEVLWEHSQMIYATFGYFPTTHTQRTSFLSLTRSALASYPSHAAL